MASNNSQIEEGKGIVQNWWLLIAIGLCTTGAGITGAKWYISENRPPSPRVATPATDMAPGQRKAHNHADGAVHPPPPSLTAGLKAAPRAVALGNWYYDHQQWRQAIEQYRRALDGGIDNANIRTDLGNSLRFDKQPEKALEQYRIAQKEDPKHQESLFNQGGLYRFSLKQPAKAVAIWREYLKKFPQGKSAADAERLIRETKG